MELTPLHLQIAGVAIIIAMAVGVLFWAARTVLGMHRGHPVYMLPDPDDDNGESDHDGNDDGETTDL